jgi:hypothetical protein
MIRPAAFLWESGFFMAAKNLARDVCFVIKPGILIALSRLPPRNAIVWVSYR